MSDSIYDTLQKALDKSKAKFSLGYGLRGKYIKVSFVEKKIMKKIIDLSFAVTDKQDIGIITGIDLKKNIIKLDVGASINMLDFYNKNKAKIRFFGGISFNI